VTDPTDYVVRPDATIEDVDLDVEEVIVNGRRLTEAEAEALAQRTRAEARRRNLIPGRKSLTGDTVHSPRVQFRVPETVLERAEQRAKDEGISLSALAREALVHYLAS
jgi:predicted HicB family RNase H-like nuclease